MHLSHPEKFFRTAKVSVALSFVWMYVLNRATVVNLPTYADGGRALGEKVREQVPQALGDRSRKSNRGQRQGMSMINGCALGVDRTVPNACRMGLNMSFIRRHRATPSIWSCTSELFMMTSTMCSQACVRIIGGRVLDWHLSFRWFSSALVLSITCVDALLQESRCTHRKPDKPTPMCALR